MEDGKIVDMYLARNENAIKETTAKYGKSLRKIALNVCSNPSDAEECENDTYLAAWNTIPPNEPRAYLFAYLAKITRSKALNIVKAMSTQKRRAEFVELSAELQNCLAAEDSVEAEMDARALSKAVSDFLRTVSEEKRLIFMRRYFFLDSISEISGRFDIGEGKVKTVLFRMRNELREYLNKEGWNV